MNQQTIGNFSVSDAVKRVASKLGITQEQASAVITSFLDETSLAIAEHGAVHYTNYFSVILRKRAPRKGVLNHKDGTTTHWETPARTAPVFEASSTLKALVQEKQGLPCT